MKGRITFSLYDPTTGMSVITKATKYGEFTATTKVSEEDKDVANRWDGQRFAEYKCDLKALKRKADIMYIRYEGVQNAYNNMYETLYNLADRSLDAEYMMYLMERQADHAYRQYEDAQNKYKAMCDNYKVYCDSVLQERRELRKHIEFQDYPEEL